jgi:hypothetical protein
MDSDLKAIQKLIRQLYQSVSFHRSRTPDWHTLQQAFWPKAQLVRSGLQNIETYRLDQFMDWVDRARAQGLVAFSEEETDASTHIMGNLAHRSSHYRATVEGDTIEGVNSIQMLKHEGKWKIISILWDVPTP